MKRIIMYSREVLQIIVLVLCALNLSYAKYEVTNMGYTNVFSFCNNYLDCNYLV